MADLEVLRELHRITERRDGATYRTEYVRDVWVPSSIVGLLPPDDHIYVVKSSSFTGQTIRRVKCTPDCSCRGTMP